MIGADIDVQEDRTLGLAPEIRRVCLSSPESLPSSRQISSGSLPKTGMEDTATQIVSTPIKMRKGFGSTTLTSLLFAKDVKKTFAF